MRWYSQKTGKEDRLTRIQTVNEQATIWGALCKLELGYWKTQFKIIGKKSESLDSLNIRRFPKKASGIFGFSWAEYCKEMLR
jgi:hypothetical protein